MGAGNGSEFAGLSDREVIEQALHAVRALDGRDGELYMQMGRLIAELSRVSAASTSNAEALRETTTVLRQIVPRLAARERSASRPDIVVDGFADDDTKARLARQVETLKAAEDARLAVDAKDAARMARVRAWAGLGAALAATVTAIAAGIVWALGHWK